MVVDNVEAPFLNLYLNTFYAEMTSAKLELLQESSRHYPICQGDTSQQPWFSRQTEQKSLS